MVTTVTEIEKQQAESLSPRKIVIYLQELKHVSKTIICLCNYVMTAKPKHVNRYII